MKSARRCDKQLEARVLWERLTKTRLAELPATILQPRLQTWFRAWLACRRPGAPVDARIVNATEELLHLLNRLAYAERTGGLGAGTKGCCERLNITPGQWAEIARVRIDDKGQRAWWNTGGLAEQEVRWIQAADAVEAGYAKARAEFTASQKKDDPDGR